MAMSQSLLQKIESRLGVDPVVEEIESLLSVASSDKRFDNRTDFKNYLGEGAMLHVSKIGSHALAIPYGEYMVWTTDVGNTVLVPSKPADQEVYEGVEEQYEVQTSQLLNNWNKVERTLYESYGSEDKGGEGGEGGESDGGKARWANASDGSDRDGEGFNSSIDASTVDRTPLLRAMQDTGMTETELADLCGVDVPAISRILRKPKDTTGDPGGRNPSMGLAAQVCNHLRIDPTAAFPDIFGVKSRYKPRSGHRNRGSGMTNAAHGSTKKGEATKQFTQGNSGSVGESVENLCEEIAYSGFEYAVIWESILKPTLIETKNSNPQAVLTELNTNFSKYLKNPFKRTAAPGTATSPASAKPAPTASNDDAAVNAAYAKRLKAGKGKEPSADLMGGAKKRDAAWEKRKVALGGIVNKVKQRFLESLQEFKTGIRDKMMNLKNQDTARHVWNVVNHLTKHVEESATEFLGTMQPLRDPAGVAREKSDYAREFTQHTSPQGVAFASESLSKKENRRILESMGNMVGEFQVEQVGHGNFRWSLPDGRYVVVNQERNDEAMQYASDPADELWDILTRDADCGGILDCSDDQISIQAGLMEPEAGPEDDGMEFERELADMNRIYHQDRGSVFGRPGM